MPAWHSRDRTKIKSSQTAEKKNRHLYRDTNPALSNIGFFPHRSVPFGIFCLPPLLSLCLCSHSARDQTRIVVHDLGGVSDHLVDDLLGRLDVIDRTRSLSGEEGHQLVKGGGLVGVILQILLVGQLPFSQVFLKFLPPLLIPLDRVLVFYDPHRPPGIHQSSHRVMVPGLHDRLLVARGGACLLCTNKPGANPHGLCTQGQRHGQAPPVEDPPGSNHVHRVTGQRALPALADIHTLGDQNGSGHITRVPAALPPLCADEVTASIQGLLDVLGGADHVHHQDVRSMELVHNPFLGNADGRNEEPSPRVDDDVDQLRKVSLSVVVIRLPRTLADLGEQEVDPERQILVPEALLQVVDLLLELLGGVPDSADHPETTTVGYSRRQLRTSSNIHTGQHDRVLDAQELGEGGLDDGHCHKRFKRWH
mmetsp:Transcript_17281/g.35088  ORF Transcript_17281/g.35088 Transcript_17281/m.35088 type:complete len:422 (-) Transcript_17281:113-1378(-)